MTAAWPAGTVDEQAAIQLLRDVAAFLHKDLPYLLALGAGLRRHQPASQDVTGMPLDLVPGWRRA